MATLYISYFGGVGNGCAKDPASSETVTTSGTSAQSAAAGFNPVALLFSDSAHYVTQGADPTATATNGFYLPASLPMWVSVTPGYKFAAITV